MQTDLTGHQVIAIRRAFPDAQIDGATIRIGCWAMILDGRYLHLPIGPGGTGRVFDGSDEAMEIWMQVREVLGC
jgi:hypothetical protein